MKKVILKAKGHAIILEGSNVKIKCPGVGKKYDKSRIMWEKNGIIVRRLSHVRISKNGTFIFNPTVESFSLQAGLLIP